MIKSGNHQCLMEEYRGMNIASPVGWDPYLQVIHIWTSNMRCSEVHHSMIKIW